jgi:tetratricopeptide (TPR) repeat protein
MGRLTALLLATSAGLLLLAGAQRLLPLLPGPGAPVAAPAGGTAGAPFGAARSPAWSTTDAMVSRLQARLQRQPDDPPAYAQLASLYLQKARETGDPAYYGKAEGAIQEVARRNADDPLALVLGGTLQLARHDFAGALSSGERAVAVAPRSAAAHGVLGDAALELGQYERAVAAFQDMIDLRPDLASYSRVAYARELHGDLPGAMEAMQLAVNAGAPRTEGANWARVQLGHLHFLSGDLEGAELQYGQALQLLPDYVHALAGQGRVAAARGDLAGAIQRYTRALELTPLPEFAIALGDLYRATGDLPAAQRQDDLVRVIARLQEEGGMDVDLEMALFEADRASDPSAPAGRLDSPPPAGSTPALQDALARARATYQRRPSIGAADALAWTLYRSGNAAEALPYAREALRLGSRDPHVLFHAGAVALAVGEREEGRAYLQASLAANPEFSVRYAPEARRLLNELDEDEVR